MVSAPLNKGSQELLTYLRIGKLKESKDNQQLITNVIGLVEEQELEQKWFSRILLSYENKIFINDYK